MITDFIIESLVVLGGMAIGWTICYVGLGFMGVL
jgi:hypothetical protein